MTCPLFLVLLLPWSSSCLLTSTSYSLTQLPLADWTSLPLLQEPAPSPLACWLSCEQDRQSSPPGCNAVTYNMDTKVCTKGFVVLGGERRAWASDELPGNHAWFAIDRNAVASYLYSRGSYFSTDGASFSQPWWAVDLGSYHEVEAVDILERTGGAQTTAGLEVRVGDKVPPLAGVAFTDQENNPLCGSFPGPRLLISKIPCSTVMVGRYITIQSLPITTTAIIGSPTSSSGTTSSPSEVLTFVEVMISSKAAIVPMVEVTLRQSVEPESSCPKSHPYTYMVSIFVPTLHPSSTGRDAVLCCKPGPEVWAGPTPPLLLLHLWRQAPPAPGNTAQCGLSSSSL